MNTQLTLTLLANSGVLVKYNAVQILIDGIFRHNVPGFSNLPDHLFEEMMSNTGQFNHIDYLLFSHNHPDHYSPVLLAEYLKKNTVKRLFLPDKPADNHVLEDTLRKKEQPYTILDLPLGNSASYQLESTILLKVFPVVHMDPQYSNIINYCYLLELGNKINILFTADADFTSLYYEKALDRVQIDTVFINPLFFNNTKGRELLENVIRPRQVVIYHIPFEQDDTFGYQRIVNHDIEKYHDLPFAITALSDNGQSEIIC